MRRIINILWALPVLVLLMSACNSDGEYVKQGNTICHSYWTFSFGTRYDTLPQVNPSTFKSLGNWLGHDGRHAYFKARLVPGVDVASMKADKYPLFHDKNDYYYKGVPLHVSNEDDIWAKDNKWAYYDSIRINTVDVKSFNVKSWNTAVDSKYVYRFGKILPLADPLTYDEEWKGLYSRDKSHIWYCGELIEDADYATFEVNGNEVRDKHGHFHNGKRISEQEWQQIKDND